jgi:hypothetical protein
VPAREWLAVVLPGVFGGVLLGAGAFAAADADVWMPYVVAAVVTSAAGIAYTLKLASGDRLFLRSDRAIAKQRSRTPWLMLFGWAIGAAAVIASGVVGESVRSAIYAALGGAVIGLWPGLVANFVRLRRERQ